MYKLSFLFFFFVLSLGAQSIRTTDSLSKKNNKNNVTNKPTISLYKIISSNGDSTYVDTTLNLKKDYKFNYLRKDNFNLIQFANTGQTYNTLSFDNSSQNILPNFSAQARHFNYIESEDVNYYNVPTPLTELYFKTVFSQGQNLDAFFTVNTSKRFNFSIAYKGLRSLGNYQNSLTSTGNFRFTTNFVSKSGRYKFKGHITMQDLFNEENGGLSDSDVQRFIDGDEEIKDRSVFDPNFENADNILEGKRFYFGHSYDLIKKKDSISNNILSLNNTISFEDKFYEYNQAVASNDFFGSSFSNTIQDRVTFESFFTDIGLTYKNESLGKIGAKVNFNDINYGYNSLVLLNNQTITNRIKNHFFGLEGEYSNQFGNILVSGNIGANLSSQIKGSFFDAKLKYSLSDKIDIEGGLNINSILPGFNFLLNQSDYLNYNWDNQNSFSTINSQQFSFKLYSPKYANILIDITNIENHTFFELQSIQNNVRIIKPRQYEKSIHYLRIKFQKDFRIGKFGLDNTILYQNVSSEEDVLNLPVFITRNTIYYSDEVFSKALKFQTGITLNYFSEYNGNGYDPLLAEFYNQNQSKIGGFPRLDFFINAKVRQTRIYVKAEHFNSSFTGYDYFSAPNHPYRDFAVRFGIVWNFFL